MKMVWIEAGTLSWETRYDMDVGERIETVVDGVVGQVVFRSRPGGLTIEEKRIILRGLATFKRQGEILQDLNEYRR